MKQKILMTLVLLMTVATGAWADIAVGNVFKTGSTIDFGTSSVRYKQSSGSSDNSSMGISGMVTLTYEEYSNGEHKFCFPMGSSAQFMYIVSDNNAEPWGIRVSGGEGTMGNPYSFEVLFEEQVSLSINNNKDEATFTMPASDATVDYDIVRDMEIAVNAVMPANIRLQQKQQGSGYEPIDATKMIPEVKDAISGTAVPMIEKTQETEETGDYTLQLQKKVDNEWTYVSPDVLGPGTYRYVVTGANLYDGTTTTNEFRLTEGYPVTVPAHGFVTYYSDEKLTINDEDATLYTIQSVTATNAVLSSAITVAPANTPLIIYNTSDEPKTFLLIPTDGDADEVSYAAQFKGTLVDKEMPGSDDETDYYVCNGFDFAWVKQAGTLAANRCWIEIANQSQGARTINIVFGDGTGLNAIGNGQLTNADGDLYDLNGRKVGSTFNVQRSTLKKGVYIRNGKKVIKK